MEILSVSLHNFKIHRDRCFEFQPGVNAICGENGSGKTSILEAIAWVLFNHSHDYRKEELYRQGSKNTQVTVRIISAADGRTYDVQRHSSKNKSDSYIIYDPQLDSRVEGIHRLEDGEQWLRQHLGITSSGNLSKLFGDVIGIPQGTFTADFLKSVGDRRKVFDPILQVEDYKAAYQASVPLEQYAKKLLEQAQQTEENLGQRLQDWPQIQAQADSMAAQVHQGEQNLATLAQQLTQAQNHWQALKSQGEALQQLQQTLTLGQQQRQQLEHTRSRQTQALQEAQDAATCWQESREGFLAHEALSQKLQQYHEQRGDRDNLQRQWQTLDQQRQAITLEQASLQGQVEALNQVHQTLETLEAQIPQQQALEAEIQQIQHRLTQWVALAAQSQALERQAIQVQQRQQQIHSTLEQLTALEPLAATVSDLEAQYQRWQVQHTHGVAAQAFEQQLSQMIENGKTHLSQQRELVRQAQETLAAAETALPLWSASLHQVQTTLTLGIERHGDLLNQLQGQILEPLRQSAQPVPGDGSPDLEAWRQQHQAAQQAQMQVAQLPMVRSQLAELEDTLAHLNQQIQTLATQRAAEPHDRQQLQHLQEQLQALGDPRSQAQRLRQHIRQGQNLIDRLGQLDQLSVNLQHQQEGLASRLALLSDLDQQIQALEVERQIHSPAYITYVQNQQLAQTLPQRQQELEATTAQLAHLEHQLASTAEQLEAAQAAWNPDHLLQAQTQYLNLERQRSQVAGALPEQQRELNRLQQELQQRQAWATDRDRWQAERERRQTITQLVATARRVYNQSGPRVTGFYLDEVCREGDRLFRDLMNRPGVALRWTEDYEIQIQEEQGWRVFRTLSGGEQMAAALAVRLALLKVLADLDVAFFDEPTTNMDRDRREQLAEALANLKTFRQLFIISHDDTFEHVTENIIRVDRVL